MLSAAGSLGEQKLAVELSKASALVPDRALPIMSALHEVPASMAVFDHRWVEWQSDRAMPGGIIMHVRTLIEGKDGASLAPLPYPVCVGCCLVLAG